MKRIYQRCCGIDVHKATLSACVRVYTRDEKLSQEIRSFGTTSAELLSLHDWLSAQQVSHVAMEATGVYWKSVYYVLEQGFTMLLVNPAEIKRLPGRKTDVSDSAWLAQLLENGLLRPTFIPPRAVRELRDLVRYRMARQSFEHHVHRMISKPFAGPTDHYKLYSFDESFGNLSYLSNYRSD
jgi:transposase